MTVPFPNGTASPASQARREEAILLSGLEHNPQPPNPAEKKPSLSAARQTPPKPAEKKPSSSAGKSGDKKKATKARKEAYSTHIYCGPELGHPGTALPSPRRNVGLRRVSTTSREERPVSPLAGGVKAKTTVENRLGGVSIARMMMEVIGAATADGSAITEPARKKTKIQNTTRMRPTTRPGDSGVPNDTPRRHKSHPHGPVSSFKRALSPLHGHTQTHTRSQTGNKYIFGGPTAQATTLHCGERLFKVRGQRVHEDADVPEPVADVVRQ